MEQPLELEFVPDDFPPGEHEKLDKQIRNQFPGGAPACYILYTIIQQSRDRFLQRYGEFSACDALIKREPRLSDMASQGWKDGYKPVRLLKLLRQEPVLMSDEHQRSAIEHGWKGDYVGDAADALWVHIQEWSQAVESTRHFYAKYCAIVQSSGMGKSRTVDEMSKSHLVIPVNLRGPDSTGYPPADSLVYDYLSISSTQREAFIRSCSFLHALFRETGLVLRDIKEERVAEQFREYMAEGMQQEGHGPFRTNFYEAVIAYAKECSDSTYGQCIPVNRRPSDNKVDEILRGDDFPLRKAFNELRVVLAHESITTDERSHKRSKLNHTSAEPLVVLAFDEVHTLTELEGDSSWSRFGELRRAIRGLLLEPLFTLFLSTSGTLFSIVPTPGRDISSRMIRENEIMPPFCELGFDELAIFLDFSHTVTLSQVSSEQHLISYGRPLWARSYRSPHSLKIIPFAASKLLGGKPYHDAMVLTPNEQLACLAQRIPIEFLSAAYASQISDKEMTQVHSHMRVVLKVEDNLETIVTTSPSEPILSEAAYFMMTAGAHFSPQAFQAILKGFGVNKGELGELIVALLFIMARDNAVGNPDSLGQPPNSQRWCGLTGLLTSLFCTPGPASDVIHSGGWRFTTNNIEKVESSLASTFKDSKVYFTHFIKVHQHSVIRVEFLMRLMARGAAVLCAQGQSAVDGVIPFLLRGDEIRLDNIGVIMFQVKNDVHYMDIAKEELFLAMNPRSLKVISPFADVPVIRIVFDLAAKTPNLAPVRHGSASTTKENYMAYDFWVATLSSALLAPVGNEQSTWDSILQVSQGWKNIYSNSVQRRAKLRMSMNPGAVAEREFWENWCEPAL